MSPLGWLLFLIVFLGVVALGVWMTRKVMQDKARRDHSPRHRAERRARR